MCNEFGNAIITAIFLAMVGLVYATWPFFTKSIGDKTVPRNETGS